MPVVAAATTLSAAMLHLTLDTSPAATREVQDRLEQLARLQGPPEGYMLLGQVADARCTQVVNPKYNLYLQGR